MGEAALTRTEAEVLELVLEGLSNQEIANRRVVGIKTVETHVSHLLQKLGHRDRTQLIANVMASRLRQAAKGGYQAAPAAHVPRFKILVEDLDEAEVPEFVRHAISRLADEGVFHRVAKWVLADQLPESGGWGMGQAGVMEYVTGEPATPHDRREGGIISTYVAVRALRATLGSNALTSENFASRARSYLLQRQAGTGGFGRNVRSRSGLEVHASVRHTAFSILALLDLEGPFREVDRGLRYLALRMTPAWWSADAAPALALAGALALADRLQRGAVEGIKDASQAWLQSFDREEAERELADLAQTGSDAPLWPPYAGHHRMVLDTALSVVELLPRELPQRLVSSVERALLNVTSLVCADGGLPYAADTRTSDFGMSAFLLTALLRRSPLLADASRLGPRLEVTVRRLVGYLVTHVHDEHAWDLTYCDTVANLLMLRRDRPGAA